MIAAALAILAIGAMPAQPGPPGTLDKTVVDAVNACDKTVTPSASDIVVCAKHGYDIAGRHGGAAGNFRAPRLDRLTPPRADRGRMTRGGESGIGSCSTVGPGGSTGCTAAEIKREREGE